MTKITSKKQQLARLARKHRFAAAVYFATGIFPPLPTLPRFQTSSATITPSTIFVSHQKG
jgi:hypothetical protein